MIKSKYLLLIVLANIFEFASDASFKIFARTNKILFLYYGIISNVFIMILLYFLLKISNLVYMNALWEGSGLIFETILSFILLKETLTNSYQYYGLFFIILGISFMNYGKIPY